MLPTGHTALQRHHTVSLITLLLSAVKNGGITVATQEIIVMSDVKANMLVQFKAEVLDVGPESTLPCNLSDKWLDILTAQADEVFEGEGERRAAELLSAVLHILFAQNKSSKISFEDSELLDYFRLYRIELAIEEVSRRSGIKLSAATIATIFTNREVERLS